MDSANAYVTSTETASSQSITGNFNCRQRATTLVERELQRLRDQRLGKDQFDFEIVRYREHPGGLDRRQRWWREFAFELLGGEAAPNK